ncbi:MAG TPA: translation initiation factor IF-2 [Microbacteriaceae bacterium]|nr:translation initiation factor IF-2 [Microbacteriaceae bacterium]
MAGKPRVHEIAAELGIDSKRTLEKLKEIGEFVKGPSSTVEPPVARKLKAAFAEEGVVPVAKEEKPAAPAKPVAAPVAAPAAPSAEPEAPPAAATEPVADPNAPKPSATGIPRPGNNPFSSNQGMAKSGIPRPGNNPFASAQGMGRPAPGRPGQGATPRRPDDRPGGTRPPFQQRTGGPGRPGGAGPGGGPGAGGGDAARPGSGRPGVGGRGRGPGGGTAGAFGRGGSKSRSRKSKRTKRQEYEMREAPSIGGVSIPRGNGKTVIRLRQGASMNDFADKIEIMTGVPVPPGNLVTVLFQLGEMATATESLDAATFEVLGSELGYSVEIVSPEDEDKELLESFQIDLDEEEDEEDLVIRPPVVTVMGHVDHGKTSLLDFIRKDNVIAGEAGGITQHIGAYSLQLPGGQTIAFLDTPGHEAFTAMRARGAQVTDIVIIVISADDSVMPQTKEAISHAQAAGVPMVFAINKVDRPDANPERIKEQLSQMNLLVEDWGGKLQSQEISAKTGLNVDKLLEKVLLEAEMLDLKADPNRMAKGTVIEATLDKGRGYVTTLLNQSGTLRIGNYILVGPYSGKVRAMMDERGNKLTEAGPSMPVSILGLDGAPQAGDNYIVMEDEREAKAIATRRQQLSREQSVRSQKNLTLEEIGRRLAVGDFQELNIVLKGDVDGSIEALADSLQRLSTEEIQVNIIHKAVGGITDSDVLLASASKAVIVGFQVRPAATARKLADKENIEIRLYSIIYDAINDIKDAMSGMLSPDVKEEITCTLEIRETFKISKVGTIAGCMVTDGAITRNTRVRIIRQGVVVYTGELGSLKRFKDDVKEVKKGMDCGLNIKNFNDIKVGDIIEGFQEVEVQREL